MVHPRYGSQTPTFEVTGKYAYSDGRYAVDLFRGYGATFFPCQEHELELFLARDENGDFATLTICISKPRQNGKSYGARWYAVLAAVIEGKKVLFSAHHGRTVRKMFKAIREIVEGNPDIAKELKPKGQGVYKAAGSEGIYFANGGMIEFQTRTSSGARGETYDIIIVDEAQELTQGQVEAMKPTTLASDSGDPQMIYLGTPPGPECSGTVFKQMHDKVHAGGEGIWWLEWSEDEPQDLSDHDAALDAAYRSNPALGYGIRERVMVDAIQTATDAAGFNREYLNWWSKSVANAAISATEWALCATEKPPEGGIVSYGVKFTLDGKWASLAACIRPESGKPHIEVVQVRSTARGITSLANWLAERKGDTAQITIDGKAKAELLEKKLRSAKCPKRQVVVCQTKEVTGACSMLEDMVSEGSVTHFDQPGLNESVKTSPKRLVGNAGGWAFDGDQSAAIESCALALYGAMTTKRNPQKKERML